MNNTLLIILVLGISLLVMAGINIYALMKLIPLIDDEDKSIHELQDSIHTIRDTLGLLVAKLQTLAGGESGDAAALADQLEAPLQAIAAESLDGIDESLAASEGLLSELDGLDESQWQAWHAANQMQIRNLLKTQESQRRRLDSLRMELDQARGTILNLRSTASRQAMGAMQAASLQAKNVAIEQELWSLKAERGRLQKELKDAQKELAALQARMDAGSDADAGGGEIAALSADDSGLQDKLQALEAKLAELTAANASLQSLHERTMLEKQFIEDAFLRIDAELGLGVKLPPPPAA